ncbi:MAG: hypothetical protein R6W67_08845 [Bacteroidales bacterium]
MLGNLIAAILGLVRKGEYARASENLNQIYYDMLKQDAAYFRTLPENELTDKLLQEHNYTNGHLEILAELFNAEAELSIARGNEESTLTYTRKALLLFEYIDKAYKTYSQDRIDKMHKLRERITGNS